jgi:phosphoserine aminotransferase
MRGIDILRKKFSTFSGYSISTYDKKRSLINVSPGPAMINKKTIKNVSDDLNEKNKFFFGNTPLEMSHRSPEFLKIITNLNLKLRHFMEIPDDFHIIWTQGGGHGQFSSIPLHFLNYNLYYGVSGTWSERAYIEACQISKRENIMNNFYNNSFSLLYDDLPSRLNIPKDADFLYLCSNETVNGTEFRENGIQIPERNQLNKTKLIMDMSSDFMMKKINWNNLDMVFACSSKNMGVAGANVVILRKDLLDYIKNINHYIPSILDWKLYINTNSLYNTPAIFNLYLFDYIINDYIKKYKTIEQLSNYNQNKAELLYNFFDTNNNFNLNVKNKLARSNINIPFIVENGNKDVHSDFLKHCYENNLVGLRTLTPFNYEKNNIIEPLRISLYNGVSINQTKKIIKILKSF